MRVAVGDSAHALAVPEHPACRRTSLVESPPLALIGVQPAAAQQDAAGRGTVQIVAPTAFP